MVLQITRSWTAELENCLFFQDEPGENVVAALCCELIEREHPSLDDLTSLATMLDDRLDISLSPARTRTVFSECAWPFAEAYLRRHLGRTQAYNDPLMPDEWILKFLEDLLTQMPNGTRWYSSEHTHKHVGGPADLAESKTRIAQSLLEERTFEICVAGVGAQRLFLFYAWDED